MSNSASESKKRKLDGDFGDVSRETLLKIIEDQEAEIEELKLQLEDLKSRADEYVSQIVIKEQVMGFSKSVLEDQKIEKFVVPEEIDQKDANLWKLAKKQHEKLTPIQQAAFHYLNTLRIKNAGLIPKEHVLGGLSEIALIRILLTLASQIKGKLSEKFDCVGNTGVTYRPNVSFFDQYGTSRTMGSSRIICCLAYKVESLLGREASHLCGNGICLNSDHIMPESHAKNISREHCHSNGLYGLTDRNLPDSDRPTLYCKHDPPCLESLKAQDSIAKQVEFQHDTFQLTDVNYVENRQGGLNVQLNDHEYLSGGGGRYYCKKYQDPLINCQAYLKITGLVERGGTASAIERGEHAEGCPNLSELSNDWLENSHPLTEATIYKRDEENKPAGYKIGLHKYFLMRNQVSWRCTSSGCSGSIKIVDGRYRDMNAHTCDAEKKQAKEDAMEAAMEAAMENAEPYVLVTVSGRGKNQVVTVVTDEKKATHYMIGEAKYSKERKYCTRASKTNKLNCTSKITVYDDGTISTTPHTCNLRDE